MRPIGSRAETLAPRRERQPAPPVVCWGRMAEQAFASDGRHRAALPLHDSGATVSPTAALACACEEEEQRRRDQVPDAPNADEAGAGADARLLGLSYQIVDCGSPVRPANLCRIGTIPAVGSVVVTGGRDAPAAVP